MKKLDRRGKIGNKAQDRNQIETKCLHFKLSLWTNTICPWIKYERALDHTENFYIQF